MSLLTLRENLSRLRETLGKQNQVAAGIGAQVLVRTPVPCGGAGECGVCAVTFRSEWRLACKDGPVFDWRDLKGLNVVAQHPLGPDVGLLAAKTKS